MIWFGYLFYGLLAVVAILFTLPMPFPVPRGIQDFLGSGYGELLFLSIWLVLLTSVIVLVSTVLINRFVAERWNASILKLLGFVSGATSVLVLWFLLLPLFLMPPFERIYLENRARPPDEFSNRYFRYKTIDCRDLSKEYGIVFISKGIPIETDYLSYAPERSEKTISWLPGRKFGEDWYWNNTGSQWDRDLFNCVNRNKAPSESF